MRPTHPPRRQLLRQFGACAALAAGAGLGVTAQDPPGPSRLRILCPAPPGSTPDLVARTYAEALSAGPAGAVIVDNRPGAAGLIAIAALKQSAPDGATMLLAPGTVATLNPHLYARLPYDAQADLAAVSLAADTVFGLAIGPAAPAALRNFDEFAAWARAHPSACLHGSPGIGSLPHLLSLQVFRQIRVEAQHVPYTSGPQAIGDLLGGRLTALVLPEGLLRPLHAAGRLRLLATSGAERSPFTPEVPSFAEQGHPGLTARDWFGFFMPGGTPAALLERMSQALRSAAESERIAAAFAELALRANAATPAAMAERIAVERQAWRAPIAALGIRIE